MLQDDPYQDNNYTWYDPIIEPPVSRSMKDRRMRKKHLIAGTALGAAMGGGLSYYAAKNNKSPQLSKELLIGSMAGATAGGAIGRVSGNYALGRHRKKMGEPLYSEKEIKNILNKEFDERQDFESTSKIKDALGNTVI